MLIIFMFLAGVTGSVALCNVASTISDLFGDDAGAGQAMAREFHLLLQLYDFSGGAFWLPGSLCLVGEHRSVPRESSWRMDR